MSARTWRTSSHKLLQKLRLRRREGAAAASSTSTRSTRSRASPTTPPSPATCRARACSRPCSSSSKAPWHRCRRRAGASTRNQDFLQVDTTNILFICGGAFDGLEKVIRNRTEQVGIGFGAEVKSKQDKQPSADVLRKRRARGPDQVRPDPRADRPPAGGRHAGRTRRSRAGADPDRAARTRWSSSTRSCSSMEGVELEVRPDGAARPSPRKALERKTGARGLRSILEMALLDTMYDLPRHGERLQGGGRRSAPSKTTPSPS